MNLSVPPGPWAASGGDGVPSCSKGARAPNGADDESDSFAMDRGHGGEVTGGEGIVKTAGFSFRALPREFGLSKIWSAAA